MCVNARDDTHSFAVPDWVPLTAWAAFVEMRNAKRLPVTAYAAARLFEQLEAIASEGWDLAVLLDRATVNGWPDLRMPIKGRDGDPRKRVAVYDSRDRQAAYLEKMKAAPFGGGAPSGPRSLGQLAAVIAGVTESEGMTVQ